ncbi:transcription factor E4F1 isoform 5-T5 [Sylvia borin]
MATGAGPAALTAEAAGPGRGAPAAASGPPPPPTALIGLPPPFGEQDEDDVHKCGRCQSEFSSLEEFVQHKLQKGCQRPPDALAGLLGQEGQKVVPAVEESITVAHIVVEASSIAEEISNASAIVGSGHIKEVIVAGDHVFENPNGHVDGEVSEEQGSPEEQEQDISTELIKVKLQVNKEGRYVCELCQKTFKTASILKAHMITHSSRKDYECKLCGTSFRTKGSLIRHHRRHTDERPYKCKKCGKSFRESGALTRHLKSLTPCTEKIRFNMTKEVVVNKDDLPSGSCSSNTDTMSSIASESIEASPVIHLVTDAKGNVLHEVHVQMQELPVVDAKPLEPDQPHPEELQCEGEVNSENLLRQAMRNSGIVIERVAVEEVQKPDEPAAAAPEELEDKGVDMEEEPCGQDCAKLEGAESPPAERANGYKRYICSHCNEAFNEAAALETHSKSHSTEYKPFKCEECGKEFTKGYLLKKHQEVHVNERRFRCGECGKLYKTIAHVKGHRRVHSDERPYACPKCGKRYKTKNAQQVHFRTHLEDKPYVCQFCSRGFREKGSLVRHIRHHTGEKPFKCYKCGRGFAEHGTLNRHLKTKGGCLLAMKEVEEVIVSEESQSADNLAATVLSEDPHTVLVEFSSVVADTQEYIIETSTEDMETSEATEIIEGTRHEVDSHIMKVVQQIVNQANSGHQIIVQNVTVAEGAAAADAADTITIATPESLTEQVAMTLASAIGDGAVLATEGGLAAQEATVTMVASEDIEIMEHAGEFVIAASQEGEVEVQTVIV